MEYFGVVAKWHSGYNLGSRSKMLPSSIPDMDTGFFFADIAIVVGYFGVVAKWHSGYNLGSRSKMVPSSIPDMDTGFFFFFFFADIAS